MVLNKDEQAINDLINEQNEAFNAKDLQRLIKTYNQNHKKFAFTKAIAENNFNDKSNEHTIKNIKILNITQKKAAVVILKLVNDKNEKNSKAVKLKLRYDLIKGANDKWLVNKGKVIKYLSF